MNELNNMCKAVSIVSIVSGVIMALLPKSKLTNAVNTLSAIIVLYAFMLPLSDFNSDYKINNNFYKNEVNIESSQTEILLELSEKELKKTVDKILRENKFNVDCEIELKLNEREDIQETIIIKGNLNDNDKELIITAIENELERSVYIEFYE